MDRNLTTGEPPAVAVNVGALSPSRALAVASLLLGLAVAIYSVSLTFRAYMPCPFWDEWKVIADISAGARPSSWSWLWSQSSEHRILSPRLLIWLDLVLFRGRNISLFIEMYAVMFIYWAAICIVLERLENYPRALKLTLQGLFAFCIFHPNQAQNLTWAFQVSFILPFAIGAVALLLLAYSENGQRSIGNFVAVGCAPLFAATNLASGLLIAPALMVLGVLRRVPRRVLVILSAVFSTSIIVYFIGYSNPGSSSPGLILLRPLDVVHYVLNLLGASWALFPPLVFPSLSLLGLIGLTIAALRRPEEVTRFEWFCIAACALALMTAVMIACGRLKYGLAQAAESRYQTVAMLYWASFFSLLIIGIWRRQPARLRPVQLFIVLIGLCSVLELPPQWTQAAKRADQLQGACAIVMAGRYDAQTAQELYPEVKVVERGTALLRKVWAQH